MNLVSRYKNPNYQKEYQSKYYVNYKEEAALRSRKRRELICNIINPYRNKPCEICKKSFPVYCMDFHHVDPNNKIEAVSNMIDRPKKYTIEDIRTEIKKCIVVCVNCHTEIESKGHKKYPQWFIDYKSNLTCEQCGFNGSLEFHHKDPSTKITSVSHMIRNSIKYPREIVIEEMKKCRVLCRCCHRIIEYELKEELRDSKYITITLLMIYYNRSDMFNYLIYLNDNCPPRNQYVLTNCVNIMNEIYGKLRQKYRIPQYIDKEKIFDQYLRDNENVDEIYLNDLPTVCKSILESCNGHSDYPPFLNRRIKKLKNFFESK